MSKNVAAIKALYEDAFSKLHVQMRTIIEHGEMSSPAEQSIREQVRWIHDLGKTMLVVNQIEGARKKQAPPQQPQAPTNAPTNAQGQAVQQPQTQPTQQTPQQRLRSPTEEIVMPPPTRPSNQREPPSNNLGNIPSPGGWSN